MADTNQIRIAPSGDVIATGVSYEDFLADYDGQHMEWVYGDVIQRSPVSQTPDDLTRFLRMLFQGFLELTGGGRVLQGPMVMKSMKGLPGREPDLQVLLPDNLDILRENEVAGAADLVVEIVSPESHRRDRVEKFAEYERGGVKEYWIVDSERQDALFYHLNENGVCELVNPDEAGIYHSVVLKGLKLWVALLWEETLPGLFETADMIKAMLEEK